MRDRQCGPIINLSSSAGRLAIPYFGVYRASKSAIEAYCEALHYELKPFGIESILVEPSGHNTDLVNTSPADVIEYWTCLKTVSSRAIRLMMRTTWR